MVWTGESFIITLSNTLVNGKERNRETFTFTHMDAHKRVEKITFAFANV